MPFHPQASSFPAISSDELVRELIDHQKSVADNLLDSLYWIYPSVIAAGGCARDWYQGLPAKDIDIYITHNNHNLVKRYLQREFPDCESLQTTETDLGEGIPEHYRRNKDLRGVLSFTLEDVAVQVMTLSSPTHKLLDNHFPVSSSKFWYKHRRAFASTEAELFLYDKIQLMKDEYFPDLHTDKFMLKTQAMYPADQGYTYMRHSTYVALQNDLKQNRGGVQRHTAMLEALLSTANVQAEQWASSLELPF